MSFLTIHLQPQTRGAVSKVNNTPIVVIVIIVFCEELEALPKINHEIVINLPLMPPPFAINIGGIKNPAAAPIVLTT